MIYVLVNELTEEFLNELLERGEIFELTEEGSIATECDIVLRDEPIRSGDTKRRIECLPDK